MTQYTKCVVLSVVLLLTLPSSVGGGPVCYVSCLAAVGGTAIVGTTLLPAIGFTSSGITAGSWAATWMASFGGAVPAGGMFATCQAAGMTGVTANFVSGVTGSATSVCAALCALLP